MSHSIPIFVNPDVLDIEVHRFLRFIELFPKYYTQTIHSAPDRIFRDPRLPPVSPLTQWYAESGNLNLDMAAYHTAMVQDLDRRQKRATAGDPIEETIDQMWQNFSTRHKFELWVSHTDMDYTVYRELSLNFTVLEEYARLRSHIYALKD